MKWISVKWHLIGPHINYNLSINCNSYIWYCQIKLDFLSIHRLMYGSHEYSDLVSKILNMHIKISWSSHSYRSVDWPKSSCHLLLLLCTAIISYHFAEKPVTSIQQWHATDKQEICYLAWVCQGERKPPQIQDTGDNSTMVTLLLFYVWAMV